MAVFLATNIPIDDVCTSFKASIIDVTGGWELITLSNLPFSSQKIKLYFDPLPEPPGGCTGELLLIVGGDGMKAGVDVTRLFFERTN